jgi:hypothetical protein
MNTKLLFAILVVLFALPANAQQVVECRDLPANGSLASNETIINGKACRPAGTPLQASESNPKPRGTPAPVAATAAAMLAPPAPAPVNASSDGKTRVFVTDSQSWETRGGGSAGGNKDAWAAHSWTAGGARPQTAEIIKTLNQRCPEITVTSNVEKADFVLTLDHEGGKGLLAHRNKVAVFNRDGDDIFSASTRELGNSVKDACQAMLSPKK